jgi:hypothetical protein
VAALGPLAVRVHWPLIGVNVPDPLDVIVTVPPGLVGAALMSVTVALQLVGVPTTTDPGVQVTVVVVA